MYGWVHSDRNFSVLVSLQKAIPQYNYTYISYICMYSYYEAYVAGRAALMPPRKLVIGNLVAVHKIEKKLLTMRIPAKGFILKAFL
jgi:hypothetical protein